MVYTSKLDSYLPGLYYLILWKGYSQKENTWKSAVAILHLYKLINIFHHDYPEKSIAIFLLIDSTLPIARPIVKPKAETLNTK